jgi:hypothetical protein
VQQVEALVVGEEGVRAVVEEEVHDVVVAALCSPQHGCCDGVSTLCIDGRAGLDKEVAEGVVVVDGSPLVSVSFSILSIRCCASVRVAA